MFSTLRNSLFPVIIIGLLAGCSNNGSDTGSAASGTSPGGSGIPVVQLNQFVGFNDFEDVARRSLQYPGGDRPGLILMADPSGSEYLAPPQDRAITTVSLKSSGSGAWLILPIFFGVNIEATGDVVSLRAPTDEPPCPD